MASESKANLDTQTHTTHMLPNSNTSAFLTSRLGLAQPGSDGKRVRTERKTNAERPGALWASVTITREHATSPALTCNNCGKGFCGGATRIRAHVLDDCTATDDAFLKLKEEMLALPEARSRTKRREVGLRLGL